MIELVVVAATVLLVWGLSSFSVWRYGPSLGGLFRGASIFRLVLVFDPIKIQVIP